MPAVAVPNRLQKEACARKLHVPDAAEVRPSAKIPVKVLRARLAPTPSAIAFGTMPRLRAVPRRRDATVLPTLM